MPKIIWIPGNTVSFLAHVMYDDPSEILLKFRSIFTLYATADTISSVLANPDLLRNLALARFGSILEH